MIDAKVIDGFTKGLLAAKYDNPKPVPDFHHEMWELCCSSDPRVALAAPREHAKSTAITHAFVLAMVLFRVKCFVLLVSDTEGQAVEFLGDIKAEIQGNEALKKTFGIKRVLKDTETNIIVQFQDGELFRILAKGSEQKVRGTKWRAKRPDLIVCDDLENDEIVMNPERREKFRKWFMNALVPCGSDTCWIRVVGTILHLDSMLMRLIEDPTWVSRVYRAHNPDFTEILWPEKFSKERLLAIRAGYEAQNDLDGYSQEYLNRPVAADNNYFSPNYFLDFDRDGETQWYVENGIRKARGLPNLEYFAAADFAISEKEKADYTAIVVVGVDPDGYLYVVDVRKGRWDSKAIIDELVAVQKMWKPNVFTFETAKIDKALGPFLNDELMRQKLSMNINKETPTVSKTMRGRSIQAKHKSGWIRYDKSASWYPDLEGELKTISDSGPRGRHDDLFDAFAYIGLTIDQYWEAQSEEEIEEEEAEWELEQYSDMGRSYATGY